MTDVLVTVLTKDPVPGKVKTRLTPKLGAEGAARFHAELVYATLDRLAQTGLPIRVALDGDLNGPFAQSIRARQLRVIPQATGDLGARMWAVLQGTGHRIVLGTDCVVFDPKWLVPATETDAAIGIAPSEDGGYWALSLNVPPTPDHHAAGFCEIPWSTADVLSTTLQRCHQRGIRVELLPTCYDIDLPSDLVRLLHDPRCPDRLRSLLETLPCL